MACASHSIRRGRRSGGPRPARHLVQGQVAAAQAWRHLLPALAGAGFHAVAPFMRGYAPTEIPADRACQLGALVADAVALHQIGDGDGDAVLIGPDWGAGAAYGGSRPCAGPVAAAGDPRGCAEPPLFAADSGWRVQAVLRPNGWI